MQNDQKKIPLGVKVESLKKIYDDLRSDFSRLKDEENKYSSFLLKKTPSRQQKISNEIEILVSEFDNYQGDRVKNLSASNLFRGAITQSGSGRVTRYLACISIGDWELAGVIPMGTWAL